MKYGFIECFHWDGANWSSYKFPVIGSNTLYNVLPTPEEGTRVLKEGSAEGYFDIKSFYKEVCDVLGFNPFTVTTSQLNTNAMAVDLFTEMVAAFNGKMHETNIGTGYVYPKQNWAENIIGYLRLDMGTAGTIQLGGVSTYPQQLFQSWFKQETVYESNDAAAFVFEIWPDSAISRANGTDNTINLDTLYLEEGAYRCGRIKLLIWKRNGAYFYRVTYSGQTYGSGECTYLENKLEGYEFDHIYEPDNPYDDHQKDGNEGGDGGFNDDDDIIDEPDVPSVDISQLGSINLYKVTPATIKGLFDYMTSNAPGDAILKWVTNPIQGIIACYVMPFPVYGITSESITIMGASTGVAGVRCNQFQKWSMGSTYLDYAFGNTFLDYAPYSRLQIHLPFIGIRPLNIDECVGKTIGVTYIVDNTCGACVAFVKVGGSVKYSFSGGAAASIPLTQENWGQTYLSAATAAAGALAGGVGMAAGAALQGAGIASTAAQGIAGAVQGSGAMGGLDNMVAKPTISRSGSVAGSAGCMGVQDIYLIIERPVKAKVANPAPVTGLPCGRTLSLGSLKGYNVIEKVHLHGISATAAELDEIERLLYEGVVL